MRPPSRRKQVPEASKIRNLATSSSERLQQATDGNRCRDPQLNIRQSLENLVEEREEGLKKLDIRWSCLNQEEEKGL